MSVCVYVYVCDNMDFCLSIPSPVTFFFPPPFVLFLGRFLSPASSILFAVLHPLLLIVNRSSLPFFPSLDSSSYHSPIFLSYFLMCYFIPPFYPPNLSPSLPPSLPLTPAIQHPGEGLFSLDNAPRLVPLFGSHLHVRTLYRTVHFVQYIICSSLYYYTVCNFFTVSTADLFAYLCLQFYFY